MERFDSHTGQPLEPRVSKASCSICGQARRQGCSGGELDDDSQCPGEARRGGDPRVSEDMVRRAALAFVQSADHEVRHIDIRAALEAVLA
jgi:hypothetical protein